MRIYITGNDEIPLCREPPTAVNEGEIVIASSEELHAAPVLAIPKSACFIAGLAAHICCSREPTRRSSGAKRRAMPLRHTRSSGHS